MAFLIGLLLALGSVLVVAWPLVRRERRGPSCPAPPEAAALEARWHALLEEMVSLQMDAEMGRLPPGEARERLEALRREAARVLKAIREGEAVRVP